MRDRSNWNRGALRAIDPFYSTCPWNRGALRAIDPFYSTCPSNRWELGRLGGLVLELARLLVCESLASDSRGTSVTVAY
jgi:hypothetical protein